MDDKWELKCLNSLYFLIACLYCTFMFGTPGRLEAQPGASNGDP